MRGHVDKLEERAALDQEISDNIQSEQLLQESMKR
jgi:hypothetical protein